MRLIVAAFGKLKTPGLRETADYYKKLIRPWIPVDEIELKPEIVSKSKKDAANRLRIQAKEGELLLHRIEKESGGRALIFLLDERGKAKPTERWAEDIRTWEKTSVSHICFCIGSSIGFSEEVRNRAKGLISFGEQTLPHELARVVLLEQLYRATSVVRGHPYHNAD